MCEFINASGTMKRADLSGQRDGATARSTRMLIPQCRGSAGSARKREVMGQRTRKARTKANGLEKPRAKELR